MTRLPTMVRYAPSGEPYCLFFTMHHTGQVARTETHVRARSAVRSLHAASLAALFCAPRAQQ